MDSEDSVGQYITLNPSQAEKFWMPDVFIDQAKALRIPTYYTKPASLRVYNDSTIRYSSRINYDVACNMDFHRFPVDEQYCEVKFESFGFSSKQVVLCGCLPTCDCSSHQVQMKWLDQSHSNVNANISLAQFSFNVILMDSYSTDYYDIAYPGLVTLGFDNIGIRMRKHFLEDVRIALTAKHCIFVCIILECNRQKRLA